LDTVAKLPFYIVLRAVLCCVNLNWVCGAYCLSVRWLLAHSVLHAVLYTSWMPKNMGSMS